MRSALVLALVLASCTEPVVSPPDTGCQSGRVLACGTGACTQTCLPAGTWGACVCVDAGIDATEEGRDATAGEVLEEPGADGAAVEAGGDGAGLDAVESDTEAGCVYPTSLFGTSVGATLRPFWLDACANFGSDGGVWRFDQADFCTSRVTVVSISAGWCVPCQNETAQLERTIVEAYRGRGVRVVQVLVQDANHQAIGPAFCRTWVTRYSLSIPELMDPDFLMQPYVPNAAFPGNIVVDARGRIRWREYGSDRGLAATVAAIEDVLAHPDP